MTSMPLTPPAQDEHESETPYKGTPVWNVKATIVKYRVALAAVLLVLIVVIVLAACGVFSSSSDDSSSSSSGTTTAGNVTIYHAGSLVGLMDDKLAPAFTAATGIATSLVAKADVFISADASVNSELLMGDANDNLISWYITFGETSIGIGYYPQSPYADVFAAVQNGSLLWYEALLQNPDMKLGRKTPTLTPRATAPLGYLGNATNRDQIFSEENWRPTCLLETWMSASSTPIDFITLPEEINMGNPPLMTNGDGLQWIASIYTVSILNNATHKSEAEEFVAYLLSSDGQTILTEQGMEAANLTAYGDTSSIPSVIATYLS
ncbi:hypothetical protein GQ600_14973 [Phytophthora cactorum]|nr:hypothetical protein GQ600_14973 [Phytophthora cactorum]